MRFILMVAVLALSCSVFASPKIGDKIHVLGTVTATSGKVFPFKIDREITNVSADKKYTIHETTEVVGLTQPQSEDNVYEESAITDRDKAKEMVANCTTLGGRPEQVTVAGQTFSACAVDISGSCTGTVWYAEVPFGIVKQTGACLDSGVASLELPGGPQGGELTFAWGN